MAAHKSYKVTFSYPGESSRTFYVQATSKRDALLWLPHGSRGSAKLDRRMRRRANISTRAHGGVRVVSRQLRSRRRRTRRNPTGTAIATAIGGGLLAAFAAYKSYDNFQEAKDAADKAEAAKIANPEALATWTKTESDSKTAAWTWGGIGLVGVGIAAVSLLSK